MLLDRKRQIDKANHELYGRMTNIFKQGSGNIIPLKKTINSYGQLETERSKWHLESSSTTKKSLHSHSNRQTLIRINDDNLRFLSKLQHLKATYNTEALI